MYYFATILIILYYWFQKDFRLCIWLARSKNQITCCKPPSKWGLCYNCWKCLEEIRIAEWSQQLCHIPHPPAQEQVLILLNPKAGAVDAHDRAKELAGLLGYRGFETETCTDLHLAALRANTLFAAGKFVLVGVGGDGTIAELVNRTSEGTPLTIFPAGNENLLARYLHLGPSPRKLAETIVRGRLINLDAGRAAGRIFLLMASCGVDAEVVGRVHAHRTGHIRSWNYFKHIWDVLRTYEYPELRVYWDEALETGMENPSLIAMDFSV